MEKILYSAVVLDKQSHSKLVNEFSDIIPDNWKIYAHHMTVAFKEGLPDHLQKYLHMKIPLNVTEVGFSDMVIAVKVDGFESNNKIPHITIAVNVNEGGQPVMSNQITDWRKLSSIGKQDITLVGEVVEVTKSNWVIYNS